LKFLSLGKGAMGIITIPLEKVVNSIDPVDIHARRVLSEVNVKIVKAKKILVVSGAGISCSSGIPVSSLFTVHYRTRRSYTYDYESRIFALKMGYTPL
jgi:hypothetical protein